MISYSQPEAVITEYMDGQAVLLQLDHSVYYRLNPVAARIWQLIGAGVQTPQALFDRLCAEYEVAATMLQTDLDACLQELLSLGLLKADS